MVYLLSLCLPLRVAVLTRECRCIQLLQVLLCKKISLQKITPKISTCLLLSNSCLPHSQQTVTIRIVPQKSGRETSRKKAVSSHSVYFTSFFIVLFFSHFVSAGSAFPAVPAVAVASLLCPAANQRKQTWTCVSLQVRHSTVCR